MLTIIGFLIVLLSALACQRSGAHSNQLLHLGALLLGAYVMGLAANRLRFPRAAGYVLAGVLFGAQGLGLIGKGFSADTELLETLLLMLLIAGVTRWVVQGQNLGRSARIAGMGIALVLPVCGITGGLFYAMGVPPSAAAILGLTIATGSPLMMYGYRVVSGSHDDANRRRVLMTGGGVVGALMLWGLGAAWAGAEGIERLRFALMPVSIGLMSILAGIAAGFVGEAVLPPFGGGRSSIHTLAVLFLLYPLCRIAGFDILFLALGVGLYAGVWSHNEPDMVERSVLVPLVVFSLFGVHLSLEHAVMLDSGQWILVGVFVIVGCLARTGMMWVGSKAAGSGEGTGLLAGCALGPVSLVAVERFLPGIAPVLPSAYSAGRLLAVLETGIILLSIISALAVRFTPGRDG